MKIARFNPEPFSFPRPRFSPLPDRPLPSPLTLILPATTTTEVPGAFRHFARGRYALHEAYRLAGVGDKGALLAPAYHCVTMLDPALALGAQVLLYPLHADLSPRLEQLDALLAHATTPVAALLATHYFGFAQDFGALRAWCEQRGVVLIEDCSHVLFGEGYRAAGAGIYGRFVVASPYKFFPVPDGGLLYASDAELLDAVATRPASFRDELRGVKAMLESYLVRRTSPADALSDQTRPVPANPEQLFERSQPSPLYRHRDENAASLRVSRLSARHANLETAIERRRHNYRRWSKAVAELPRCRALYPDLAAGTTPYMFPLYIDDPDAHFPRLKRLGLPIWRWDEMAISDCPVAQDYRLHLLHLPCHQALDDAAIDWMIVTLDAILRRETGFVESETDRSANCPNSTLPPPPAHPLPMREGIRQFSVRVVEKPGDLGSALGLEESSTRRDVEATIDWFHLLQQHVYPDDPGVRYYAVDSDDHAPMILPVRLVTKGRVKSIEALGNYYTSLYAPLNSQRANSRALQETLAAAVREHAGANVMRFAPMDPESADYRRLFDSIRALGWIPFRFFCFGNWYLHVNGNWDDYLKGRSANLRSSIRRRTKSFAARGGTLEFVTEPDLIEEAIAAFQDVYSGSWKIPEPYPRFVPSLIRHLASRQQLRMGIARLDGNPIAAQIWILSANKASIYKVAYKEKFAALSPGTVLTAFLMRRAIEVDRVKEIDFLIGDDKYKRIWMSDRRERWGLVAYNPCDLTGAWILSREIAGRIGKSVGRGARDGLARLRKLIMGVDTTIGAHRQMSARSTPKTNAKRTIWTTHPITEFIHYASEWDDLVRQRPGTPFLESTFLQAALEIFGNGEEKLCMLRSGNKLRAAAVMRRSRLGVWQTFQPSQLPLGAFISDGTVDLSDLCKQIGTKLPGLGLAIGLSQLDSRIYARPADTPTMRSQNYIETAWVDVEESFETYWEARGKNLKQNTRKQRNKLKSEGVETRIECLTAASDVEEAIQQYGTLESAGWKAVDGTAILPDNEQGRFYRKMLESYCSLGRGRIYRYWFGEKIVAMDLCIHDEIALVILKTAYDETHKALSPATLMRQDQFRSLFEERRFKRIEFYGKIMEWHTRWTALGRSLYHVTYYRWAWLRPTHARPAVAVEQVHERSSSANG